ncbi:MAG: hypothetical protein WBB29_14750 [Geitlerinemataceae cyanobacterium]
MTPQAQLALLLWLPIVFYFFTRYPVRTAVIVSFIGGLLFLPERTFFALPLIPDYKGMIATCYGIVLALIVYDSQGLSKLQLTWIDAPMVIWCICPIISSLTNGLGAYDGVNTALEQTAIWGLPYFLGRLYLNSLSGMRELALNILRGGLIYVPLCLYEGRFSPQLHLKVYGFFAHSSGLRQAMRYGGYRPNVFMEHGLMVGMWMMTVALVCIWLSKAKALDKVWGFSLGGLNWVFFLVFLWCRSTGAYIYMIYGLLVMFCAKSVKTTLPLLLLIVGMSYYLYSGAVGTFDGDSITQVITERFNADRAQSLQFRFDNEEILAEKAREKMLFGWAGWGRNRVYDYNWEGVLEDTTTVDSMWILAFGTNGVIGLASVTGSLLLPVLGFSFRYPARLWFKPQIASAAVLAICTTLFMLDSVLNNMYNPVFTLISGGLSGLATQPTESLTPKAARPKLLRRGPPKRIVAGRAYPIRSVKR